MIISLKRLSPVVCSRCSPLWGSNLCRLNESLSQIRILHEAKPHLDIDRSKETKLKFLQRSFLIEDRFGTFKPIRIRNFTPLALIGRAQSIRPCSSQSTSDKKATNGWNKFRDRFKAAYKEYGYFLIGLHIFLSLCWYYMFYLMASRWSEEVPRKHHFLNANITLLWWRTAEQILRCKLEKNLLGPSSNVNVKSSYPSEPWLAGAKTVIGKLPGLTTEKVNKIVDFKGGPFGIAYVLYKAIAPFRYAVTLLICLPLVRLLKYTGYWRLFSRSYVTAAKTSESAGQPKQR